MRRILQSLPGGDRGVTRRSWTRLLRHTPDLPIKLVERLWHNADELLEEGQVLKAGNRCTVARLNVGGRLWVLKRYNLRNWLHTAIHLPLRSRAEHCWRLGQYLAQHGLPTPRPVACLEERRGPVKGRSFLLSEHIAGETLAATLLREELDPLLLENLARQVAQLYRLLGELRVSHGDFQARNFVVTDANRLWLIDLDGACLRRYQRTLSMAQRADRARFLRDEWKFPAASRPLFNVLSAA